MSLEMMDGFDHYTALIDIQRKWDSTSGGGSYSPGRFGGLAWSVKSTNITKTLTAQTTRVLGFAMYWDGAIGNFIIGAFQDSGTTQVDVRITSTGAIQVTRNGTVLSTSAASIVTIATWQYLEFKATIGSSGSYDVHLGGTSVLSQTGVNTQATSNASANQVQVGPFANVYVYVDDLYVLNSAGSVNNTFLGESKIVTSLPNADSSINTAWTPQAGTTHYNQVNEANPDDDTTYNYSQTPGQLDTYKYPSVTLTGTIAGVQVTLCEKKDNTGTRTTAVEYRSSGGSNYTGANNFSPGTSYSMDRQIFETDPATAAAWTSSGVNGGEFGINCVA